MHTLVTGATGLLGSTLLYELAKTKTPIIALKRERSDLQRVEKIFCSYDPKKGAELFKTIHWEDADIKDSIRLDEIFEMGISRVYHVAGLVSFNASHSKRMMQTNCEATKEIVNLALHYKVEKLLYVSSIATINKANSNGSYDEDSSFEVADATTYAKSKYLGEKEVWRGTQEGLPAIIIKPGVILASADFVNESSGAIIRQAIEYNYATQGVVGFVDVRDVAKSAVFLMDSPTENEAYIAVSENKTYKEFFEEVKNRTNKKNTRIIPYFWVELASKISGFIAFFNPNWDFLPVGLKDSLLGKIPYDNSKLRNAIPFNLLSLSQSLDDYIAKYFYDK